MASAGVRRKPSQTIGGQFVRQLRALYVFKYGVAACVGVPLVLLLAASAAAVRVLSLFMDSIM